MIALAAMLAGRSDQLGDRALGPQAEPGGLWRNLEFCAVACLRLRCGASFFRALDVGALERLLGAWVKGAAQPDMWRLTASGCGAALSAMCPECICWPRSANGCKVSSGGQLRVAPEANEITAALTLLKTLPIEGAIISGDAIFAQTDLCRLIIERGGDYFFTVKSNQPTLEADIALAFRPDSPLCGVGARA